MFDPAYSQFLTMNRVEIDTGIRSGGGTPSLVGRRIYLVNLVDRAGGTLTDYVGADRHAADCAAVGLARDFGVRIEDKTVGDAA